MASLLNPSQYDGLPKWVYTGNQWVLPIYSTTSSDCKSPTRGIVATISAPVVKSSNLGNTCSVDGDNSKDKYKKWSSNFSAYRVTSGNEVECLLIEASLHVTVKRDVPPDGQTGSTPSTGISAVDINDTLAHFLKALASSGEFGSTDDEILTLTEPQYFDNHAIYTAISTP